ncbi:TetR/AcrR family transcriptional regulator [uncultured Bacteroides sp.]|uniref:TetR/AcrR family transcriptional regulator n=1 Tax=uncultured Bacteroides sp. TaxID=162156 RepID=UPI0026313F00|nr:TetR/AcrR family transcriptional regulator [uncultured Bacteroides sp.]
MENNILEEKIIAVAKEVFIEKGFDGASMSDIAARVGINRPTLHYYYRTKDKMFQAVFLSIIQSFIPKIQDVFVDDNKPFSEKIKIVVDTYLEVAKNNPYMPMFVMREINRNAKDFIKAVKPVYMDKFLNQIAIYLQSAMDKGDIKQVPLRIVFNTFYGLMSFPFLSKNLIFMESDKEFNDLIDEWKPYMVDQMIHLLCK